ncbi:hypothetical protein [Sinorhizobium sp. M4_45]|uniref:hypothetical protein n=1 Tax=Sinorhizobium TaxID=28105 RepID=UPI001AEC7A21|nr:hypothetical protein [Sinorhizobium sp. M4_45]
MEGVDPSRTVAATSTINFWSTMKLAWTMARISESVIRAFGSPVVRLHTSKKTTLNPVKTLHYRVSFGERQMQHRVTKSKEFPD